MSGMKSVLTLRLPDEDIKVIEKVSLQEKTDKSTVLRELIELGRVYFAILNYRDGRISLAKAAEIAMLSISEMIDVLSKLGVKSNLELGDYLEGAKVAEGLFKTG